MERETRIFWLVLAGVALVAALFTLGGRVREELGPRPRAAWVAIGTGDDPVATSGPVEVAAGESFTLHAVLEAEDWRGETVYYTDAAALGLGDRRIPDELLRRWPAGDEYVRVLWFTVEGAPPYLEVATQADLERLQFREVFRADWPRAWSVPGSVELSRRRQEAREAQAAAAVADFGTQRFHVRIEFFEPTNTVVPRLRIQSWGAAELRRESEHFPTVTARLAGPLEAASAVFGLPQVELAESADAEVAAAVGELRRGGLIFGRVFLLRRLLERAGRAWEALGWRAVDLRDGPEWGAGGVAPGDLLRVGERFVVLVADEGRDGTLDDADLGFDYDHGAVLRRLGEIFTGEGLVEWTPLAAAVEGG